MKSKANKGELWEALSEVGVPTHLIRLIRSLYYDQEATVRTRYGDTERFKIKRVPDKDASSFLFNLYAKVILRKLDLDDLSIGVEICGRTISNLRYSDDTTLLAESEKDLKNLILKLKEESKKMELFLNIKKTKIINITNKKVHIKINNEETELVDSFVFLGSLIDHSGGSTAEIKCRLAPGHAAMVSMDQIWKCKDHQTKAYHCHCVPNHNIWL
uniref:Uncharacterized protein LOC117357731 isoform X2 n=1 Tax=Geotrypetes seraphini TaxID=260995 RepID=A0A6P8QFL5_GEOSA|nr:uncharacterized protein LOC117357731 isoform X2 [Geotrypetes seraphini]XP_033794618.1 uncharacterized protein LOC117357731 isoform X2 [Geotrypetes seraphini]XP_033794619.1 uncharacterized protein LOC117357731 isoform X2 [Geotrypetes seraphini]XP_033794620.1 uncharacterized protein LOC117357731 isoform X2 [Geotrypetes seraphini]XP_033794621.1 uncharacterized protein LOC117357731 isoform X2 [Geotrypetes seraphini]XP_033794622.1 uncharacterized protein LOC117357731 isoform X2 [Geotrypetes sera